MPSQSVDEALAQIREDSRRNRTKAELERMDECDRLQLSVKTEYDEFEQCIQNNDLGNLKELCQKKKQEDINFFMPYRAHQWAHQAAFKGHLEILKWLFEDNAPFPPNIAKVNYRDPYDNTVLMWACYGGHKHVVEWLVEGGYSSILDEHNWDGYTPIQMAVAGSDPTHEYWIFGTPGESVLPWETRDGSGCFATLQYLINLVEQDITQDAIDSVLFRVGLGCSSEVLCWLLKEAGPHWHQPDVVMARAIECDCVDMIDNLLENKICITEHLLDQALTLCPQYPFMPCQRSRHYHTQDYLLRKLYKQCTQADVNGPNEDVEPAQTKQKTNGKSIALGDITPWWTVISRHAENLHTAAQKTPKLAIDGWLGAEWVIEELDPKQVHGTSKQEILRGLQTKQEGLVQKDPLVQSCARLTVLANGWGVATHHLFPPIFRKFVGLVFWILTIWQRPERCWTTKIEAGILVQFFPSGAFPPPLDTERNARQAKQRFQQHQFFDCWGDTDSEEGN
eukprot:TRINITY_DN66429_c5_g4_i2.p1 TRINITY_DN66429_c5_g4~~TRINITY_DN66429_c5_g4_i2.p1  ORF type:complete len:508 (-),score=31.29 TRINITY_DN66429_c5_g4_i2:1121-2644(-)